jgi:hypothetical protein
LIAATYCLRRIRNEWRRNSSASYDNALRSYAWTRRPLSRMALTLISPCRSCSAIFFADCADDGFFTFDSFSTVAILLVTADDTPYKRTLS